MEKIPLLVNMNQINTLKTLPLVILKNYQIYFKLNTTYLIFIGNITKRRRKTID